MNRQWLLAPCDTVQIQCDKHHPSGTGTVFISSCGMQRRHWPGLGIQLAVCIL